MQLADRVRQSYKVKRLKETAEGALSLAVCLYKRLRLSVDLKRRNELHIHFGCGDVDDARFVNVDARALPHVHLSGTRFVRPRVRRES